MQRGGVQASLHPHLPLLPPGKAGSLAAGNGATSTLKVCSATPPPAASGCWSLCWGPYPGERQRSCQSLGDHLVWRSLDRWRTGRGGGGDLPEVLKAEKSRLICSRGLRAPYPELGPAAFTFILKLGCYRVQRLVALSLSAGCSTLGPAICWLCDLRKTTCYL